MTEAHPSQSANPGTLKEFAENQGADAVDGVVLAHYGQELARYRMALAEARGISVEQLHHGPLAEIGKLATSTFGNEQFQAEAA